MQTKYIRTPFVKGRYITLYEIEKIIKLLPQSLFFTREIGQSVERKPIYKIQFGTGRKRVILWSQMHGNESTTTKGLIDWLYALLHDVAYYRFINTHYTICILPMVNPDGAENYTRTNANHVDLNRDAKEITQPESKILRKAIDDFQPDFALNLHDQRTIFGVGKQEIPTLLSFLAPAFNKQRDINNERIQAMRAIVYLHQQLLPKLGNRIARFDDSFNINCIGDYLTNRGIPTILYEAGHYPNDYEREQTRVCVFQSLIHTFEILYTDDLQDINHEKYFEIPENLKTFTDIEIVNFQTANTDWLSKGKIVVQYAEKLQDKQIYLEPFIDQDTANNHMFAHKKIDAQGREFATEKEVLEFVRK